MRNNCKVIFFSLVMLFAFQTNASARNSYKDKDVSSLLDTLDVTLKHRQTYFDQKQSEIKQMMEEASHIAPGRDLAIEYGSLAAMYLHVNGDSAIAYAEKALKESERIGDANLIINGKIGLLNAYNRKGYLANSAELINEIGSINGIDSTAREKYAVTLMDYFVRAEHENKAVKKVNNNLRKDWEYYSKYVDKNSADYMFFQSFCSGNLDLGQAVSKLETYQTLNFDFPNLAFAIANEYYRRGNTDRYYQYLLLSAIADIRLANTEVSSLLYLMQTPLLEKDTKRSYEYIQVLVDNVTRYQDLHRALTVVEIQNKLNKQLSKEKNNCIVAMSVAVLLFLIALVFSMIQIRLLKHVKKEKRTRTVQERSQQ